MKTTKLIPVLFVLFLMLQSCGKQGGLYLPAQVAPQTQDQVVFRQVGLDLEIRWNFPKLLSDNKTVFDPKQIRKITLWHSTEELNADRFIKKADELQVFKAKDLIIHRDGLFGVSIKLPAKLIDDQIHYFAMSYSHNGFTSAATPIQSFMISMPSQPVSDLSAKLEKKTVILKWSRPTLDLLKKRPASIACYTLYRRINPAADFSVHAKQLIHEYYEDHHTEQEGSYEYQVAVQKSSTIQSTLSNIATVKIADLYPPEAPTNLVAFQGNDHIFLSWEGIKEADFSCYRVYRKQSGKDQFTIIADKIQETTYRDTKIQKGISYTYQVIAVDQKGNESDPSNMVDEKQE